MAHVIVSKKGTGATLIEDSGHMLSVRHPDRMMKRRDVELVFSRLGYFRFASWESRELGWAAEFIHQDQPIPYVLTKKALRCTRNGKPVAVKRAFAELAQKAVKR